jgi:hypothetical protein
MRQAMQSLFPQKRGGFFRYAYERDGIDEGHLNGFFEFYKEKNAQILDLFVLTAISHGDDS